MSDRLEFIRPLSPSAAVRPPQGEAWLHEPKWDGFRFRIIKDGSDVRLHSHSGADYSDRLRGMREAFAKLRTRSAILDGELCLIDPRGNAHFWHLMAQMRTRRAEEGLLVFLVFDLLHQDGVDLCGLPLFERKRLPSWSVGPEIKIAPTLSGRGRSWRRRGEHLPPQDTDFEKSVRAWNSVRFRTLRARWTKTRS